MLEVANNKHTQYSRWHYNATIHWFSGTMVYMQVSNSIFHIMP